MRAAAPQFTNALVAEALPVAPICSSVLAATGLVRTK